jgi:large subunit ribosomal protein L4
MATIEMLDLDNKKVGTLDLDDTIFKAPIRRHLLTEMVNWQRAKSRAGTQSVKTRAEVNGTTKKPYGQKHTGNARHGDSKANIFRGGGVAFAPKPRSYEYEMPKSKRRAALATALSLKLEEGNLKVVKNFTLKEAKTKGVVKALGALKTGSTLIVDDTNESLSRAARNLSNADTPSRYLSVKGLNVLDMLRYPSLVMTEAAVKSIQARLLGEAE